MKAVVDDEEDVAWWVKHTHRYPSQSVGKLEKRIWKDGDPKKGKSSESKKEASF